MADSSAPPAVIQNIEAIRVKKHAEDIIKATRNETINYFRSGGTYLNVSYSESNSDSLNEEVILAWAHKKLTKAQYEQLFTKVFDANSFAKLVHEGVIDRSMLPVEYQTTKTVSRLTVK